MKLNEKIVSYFESCDSPVDKEGYLFKKGEIKTSYQKRWCLLKGNLLFYKERPSDRDLVGVIVLEGCTVQLCESEEQFAFSLVWSEPGLRTYKFAAEDQTGQESWIKALLWANHSYLSLLVMDLEKKYRDALKEFTGEPANPFVMPKFHLSESEFSEASWRPQPSALPAFPAAGVGTGPVLGSGAVLQASANPSNPVPKKSPKPWAMRNANLDPIPALPSAEWSGGGFGCREDFGKLHEDYGKEVKELIANWSKKGRRAHAVEEDNLIDFG